MPTKSEFFTWANSEPLETVIGRRTRRPLTLRSFTYGTLVPDAAHPLSAVSVSNSSLSIDLWTGCKWQCRYCHVQGTVADLADDGRMPRKPTTRTPFSIQEILDSLEQHPFFIRDKSVISIGTASTEPFAPGAVCESTFAIMFELLRRGLKNPLWIVTKGGIPPGSGEKLKDIVKNTRGLMISLCWANNPRSVEPLDNDRFANCAEAKRAGVHVAWYMRPLVLEWGADITTIAAMMATVSAKHRADIDMIVPGGLRWTEGIENGLVEIHKRPMPDIPRDDNVKTLPASLWAAILKMAEEYFPGTPIFLRSSCALTHMLRVPSINAVQWKHKGDCEASVCPKHQRITCSQRRNEVEQAHVQRVLEDLGIPARAAPETTMKQIITAPPLDSFTYAVRQTVTTHLSTY